MTESALPKVPLKSVSVYLLEKVAYGSARRLIEVLWVVDADGELWRKEGSGTWKWMSQ